MGGLTAPSRAPLSAFHLSADWQDERTGSAPAVPAAGRELPPLVLPADPTPSSTTPFRITLFVNLGSGLRRAVRTWMRASQARVERGERIRFFWTIGLTRPVRKFLSPMSPHPATKADFLAYGQRSHHSERLWLETPAGAGMGEADRGGGAGVLHPLRRLHSSRRSVRPRSFIRSQLLPRPVPSWMQSGGAEQAPTEEPRRCSPS
jgi:hypothetical protein